MIFSKFQYLENRIFHKTQGSMFLCKEVSVTYYHEVSFQAN